MSSPVNQNVRIHLYDIEQSLSRAAASAFVASAQETLSKRASFAVALAGGSTPKTMYALLASEFRNALEWNQVHFFWTDERFVPPDHSESNYRMACETILRPLRLPPGNIHPPDTSSSDPRDSARRYEDVIRAFFGSELPSFDWVLLGMGEDGHVASLFPGSSALRETKRMVIAITDSPTPPPVRLTMTLPLLNAAREIHFLVSGRRKRGAFSKILAQEDDHLPARRIRPTGGTVDWWVDDEAARR